MSLLLAIACAAGCKKEAPQTTTDPAPRQDKLGRKVESSVVRTEAGCQISKRPLRRESKGRVVALGDVHGDLQATRRALQLAGAIGEDDAWTGGTLTLVHTGDLLDRGDDEQAIYDLFDQLEAQAAAAGGAFVRLHGNHELMNAMGDFRYVTPGGFADFYEGEVPAELTTEARAKAFLPGGSYAKRLAAHDIVAIVDDSVFVHGGVLPAHVDGLEALNRDARCFLEGSSARPPQGVLDPEGPLWTRKFSEGAVDCQLLQASLDALGVERMVVGHTPQMNGISSACEGRVWRIDTGMAKHYGGPTQVLEIKGAETRVLGSD